MRSSLLLLLTSILGCTLLPAQASWTAFGTGCGPTLSLNKMPQIGQPFELQISGAPSYRAGAMHIGLSTSTWQSLTLPLDLSGYGMPACTLLASGEAATLFGTGSGGVGVWGFVIPNDPFLLGMTFYNQAFIVDPASNALGVIASDGGVATIG